MDFPINNWWFSIAMLVHQRVFDPEIGCWSSLSRPIAVGLGHQLEILTTDLLEMGGMSSWGYFYGYNHGIFCPRSWHITSIYTPIRSCNYADISKNYWNCTSKHLEVCSDFCLWHQLKWAPHTVLLRIAWISWTPKDVTVVSQLACWQVE